MPFLRLGWRRYFRQDQIDRWLDHLQRVQEAA